MTMGSEPTGTPAGGSAQRPREAASVARTARVVSYIDRSDWRRRRRMERTRWRMLTPLVLATMASQSLLVVLGPTIVAISRDLDTSVATVGQARSVTATVA